MQSILKYLSLLLIIVSVISCEPGKTVKVDYFTPTGEVAKLTNFVVEFSENLAPPDVQGKWLDEEFITFSPTIPGKFKWTSDNTLVFSPDVPLEPIQKYSAAINKNVLFGTNYSPDFETYNFHTPYFDVVKIDYFWTNIAHQNYKLSVQANVQFNYPVEPQSLKDFLEVSKAGQETTDYQIVSEQAAEVIAINFGEIQQTDKKQKFTIKVKKDLVSVLGKDGLQEERKFNVELPPATKLAITNVTSGFDGNTGWIEVATRHTTSHHQQGHQEH